MPAGSCHRFEWSFLHKRWVCQVCLRTKSRVRGKADNSRCEPPSKRIAAMLSGGHPSHRVRVAIAQDGPPLYFCDRCGAYAQTRPRGLLWECPPEAEITPQGRDYLRRIAKGRHPYHNSLIGGVSRVLWPRGAPRSRPGGSCARDTVHVPVALTPPVGADAMPESVQTSGGGGLSVEPAGANPTEPESVDWWEIARRKRLCNDLPFSIRSAF